MKKALRKLSAFDSKKCVNVVVETPKGSRVKYAYCQKTGLFELRKALPEGMVFPFNFGFIPSTVGEDSDPLDILIVNEEALVPGCLLKARLAGVIKAKEGEDGRTERNDRLIGFAVTKLTPTFLEDLELDDKTVRELEYFFTSYNKLEGKSFEVIGKSGPKKALEAVKQGEKLFKEHQHG